MTVKFITRATKPGQVKVKITNVAAFRHAIGDKVLLPLLRLMTGLETLVNLTDVTMLVAKDDAARGRNSHTMMLMIFGTLGELSEYVGCVSVALVNDPDAKKLENDRQALLAFEKRWKKRKQFRHQVAFHYNGDGIKRGLDALAKMDDEPVLADYLAGPVVRYPFAMRAALLGLEDQGENVHDLVQAAIEDTVKLSTIVDSIFSTLIETRKIARTIIQT